MAGVAGEGGMKRVIDGRPEAIRRNCEDSLKRLGTEVIDVYYLHRWDKKVPIEDSVGEMSRLLEAGKIRAIGLSEVSAPTIRRAHAVAPIAAVQTEYSLWSRNAEIAVLDTCREIGAAFVAFSPVARGFLTDVTPDPAHFEAKDIRCAMPRFQPENWAANLELLAEYDRIANAARGSRSQVALAWLLHRAEHIIPIPGTRSAEHVVENIGGLGVDLTPELMARLDQLFDPRAVAGLRYNAQSLSEVDTEEFAV
jgi:aryl-alcohol dehydrogenase-like predicted oxidoreductase